MFESRKSLWFSSIWLSIAFALFFWGIGDYDLWDPWEPKYAKAIEEMQARQDYITPFLNDHIRWTKPILIYWSMLVPASIAGVSEWTVRLPSALAATFSVFSIYYLLLQLRDKRTALMGACILATLPQFFYMARQAMPDMLMTACLCAAMCAFAIARFKPGKAHFFYGFYAFLALSFLTKGPVVGVICLFALCLFLLVDINWSSIQTPGNFKNKIIELWRYYRVSMGIVIFVLIAAPWYIAMLIQHGQAFIDHFFIYENITRFKEPIRSHKGLVTYYIQNLFHGMYPWSGFLPAAFLFLFYGQQSATEEVKLRWYFFSWFLAIFLLFSLAGTKQQHYILPITPSLAILVALVWQEFFKVERPFWIKPAMLLSALIVWLSIQDFQVSGDGYLFDVFTIKLSIDDGDDISMFLSWFQYAWLIIMLLAMIGWHKMRSLIAGSAILIALINGLYFTQIVMPEHSKKRSLKHYVTLFKDHTADENGQLIFLSSRKQSSLYYYYDIKKYLHFSPGQKSKLIKAIKRNPNSYIIAEKKYKYKLIKFLKKYTGRQWRSIDRSHGIYMLLEPVSEH